MLQTVKNMHKEILNICCAQGKPWDGFPGPYFGPKKRAEPDPISSPQQHRRWTLKFQDGPETLKFQNGPETHRQVAMPAWTLKFQDGPETHRRVRPHVF